MNPRISTLIAAVIAIAVAGCSNEAKLASASGTTLKANIAQVVERDVPRLISVTGIIQANNDAVLSSRAMGPVMQEHVRIGERVKKGDVLLEIEERMNRGMLSQAQGALAQAQAAEALSVTNLKRFEALFGEQACSQLELDMARMQHETAAGAIKQAQGAVDAAGAVASESMIRAPFDGIIIEKFVNIGDLVAPGRPLVRIQSKVGRDLKFNVRAQDVRQLVLGTIIQCNMDGSNQRVEAEITEFSPSADPMTHTVTVKARLSDTDSLAAGFTATAEIPGELSKVLLAPMSAIFETGGLNLVTVVDENNMARTRAVTVGRQRGNDIELLSGLVAGEIVVINRTGLIAEGTRIEKVNG